MELLLSRSQKTGATGITGISFVLDIRTKLTSQEDDFVRTYRLGGMIVYEKDPERQDNDSGLLSKIFVSLYARAAGRMFTVNDLVRGRKIECKDIAEMLEAENQIKEAAETFYTILTACEQFGGEEVIIFPREE